MQLTEQCDLWRMVTRADGGKNMTAVYTRVPCLRVPESLADKVASSLSASMGDHIPSEYFHSEARQATAVFMIFTWVEVQEEDELRHGRRIDRTGSPQPYRYTVAGIRDYGDFAYQDQKLVVCQRSQ